MILCKKCGSVEPDGTARCSYCGHGLDESEESPLAGTDQPELQDDSLCKRCNQRIEPDDEFCSDCGLSLRSSRGDDERNHLPSSAEKKQSTAMFGFLSPIGAGVSVFFFFTPWFRACDTVVTGMQAAERGSAIWFVPFGCALAILLLFFVLLSSNKLLENKTILIVVSLVGLATTAMKAFTMAGEAQQKGVELEVLPGFYYFVMGQILSLVGSIGIQPASPLPPAQGFARTKEANFTCTKCGANFDPDDPEVVYCDMCGTLLPAQSSNS